MTEQSNNLILLEEIRSDNITAVLKTLPEMGRVMVIAKTDRGVTHERIGPVEVASVEADGIRLFGACHDAFIDPTAAVRMQVDRSSVMKGKVFPHLKFLDPTGGTVFAVVGMDGTEPMEKALEGFAKQVVEKADVNRVGLVKDRADAPEVPVCDPAMVLFNQLCEQGCDVTITGQSVGIKQSWKGKIETVRTGMGFINVMTSDFHLHLKAGSVSSWAKEPGSRIALDASGEKCGLALEAVGL